MRFHRVNGYLSEDGTYLIQESLKGWVVTRFMPWEEVEKTTYPSLKAAKEAIQREVYGDDWQDPDRTYLEEERARDVRLDCTYKRVMPARLEQAA